MLINVTSSDTADHWKRASLLSTITRINEDVFRNCFREPAHHMAATLLNYQLGWPSEAGEAAAMTRRTAKIDELPGQPSVAHMVETLYTEWGQQCMGQGFWIETWKHRSRWALSQGAYVGLCDADSEAEKQAVLEICEHPIVVDADDQRFKEGLSYLTPDNIPTTAEAVVSDTQSAFRLLSAELKDLFAERSLKLA